MRLSVVLFVLVLSGLPGCLSPGDPGQECSPVTLVEGGVAYFSGFEAQGGGIALRSGDEERDEGEGDGEEGDPRVTAWVLLASRLADRAAQAAVAFDGRDHAQWLIQRLPMMLQEGTGVDSAANNVSLARAALQAWGIPAHRIELKDPDDPDVMTLQQAWEARYDEQTGRYGDRLNEHLFAGFAARVFEHDLGLLERMGEAAVAANETEDGALYAHDAWFTGYARALLGPGPVDPAFADWLDGVLTARQQEAGGVVAFEGSDRADASTTAATLLAWGAQGKDLEDPQVQRAVAWLCGIVREDGGVPFAGDLDGATVKTTAEVVIAVSLLLEPIEWPRPVPDGGPS